MDNFHTYFLMTSEDVIRYAKEKIVMFINSEKLSGEEIGDGNLNYVFRVKDEATGKSVIIKQAGHTARISDDFVLSTDRIRIEAGALQLERALAPGLVPRVYFFDEVMSCLVMDDLGSYKIMRAALLEFEMFPEFAEHITTFIAETLLRTSDIVMDHKQKKALVKDFINPELCEISEDLVFTEPYFDQFKRNEVIEENLEFVTEHLYDNEVLKEEVALLKYAFLTNAQSLLHGDLHTGSVFITKEDTKIIDPEFAFYGRMGYDIGNVVANLVFAWVNGKANQKTEFVNWVEQTIVDVIDLFKMKFVKVWKEYATELFAKNTAFQVDYLQSVITDTAGMAGLEMNRRIVGLAKVKDITSLTGQKRVQAERDCITIANRFIFERELLENGIDFITIMKQVMEGNK